jgi:hypothetical protein
LKWLRAVTEAAWASLLDPTRSSSSSSPTEAARSLWKPGTRWTGGYSQTQLDELERKWKLRFPPDYRLFLSTLGSTDHPGFYDWLVGDDAIHRAYEAVVEGLAFDVEQNQLWLDAWGPRPSSEDERRRVVSAQVEQAPKLIPVFGHRFLVAEPCESGNPVLSIHQSDIIIYGADLRMYLLNEFAPLLGTTSDWKTPAKFEVRFWGEFI